MGYKGINLPFSRYFEVIYASQRGATFTIKDVLLRCNNHGRTAPKLYTIPNTPSFYK